MDLKRKLYGAQKEIKILKGHKLTNTLGPSSIISKAHTGRMQSAKYSNVCLVLDDLFLRHSINAYASTSDDTLYVEFLDHTGERYYATISKNGSHIAYLKHQPSEPYETLIPSVMHYLSASTPQHKEKEACFCSIAKDLKQSSLANIEDVAIFCDNFYYDYAKNMDNVIVTTDLTQPEIKTSIANGLFEPFSLLTQYEDDFSYLKMDFPIPSKKERQKKNKETKMLWDELKSGKYRLPIQWDAAVSHLIPSLDFLDNFIPTEDYFRYVGKINKRMKRVIERMDAGQADALAIANDAINYLVIGKPGTGKTTSIHAIAAALGIPVAIVPMSKNTEEDVFQGITGVVGDKIQSIETEFMKVAKHGGIALIEEINLADADMVMGAIGQFAEYPYTLMEYGYRPVKRHPLCCLVGTMNVGTNGSKELSQPLSSRFKLDWILNDPDEKDFLNILKKHGNGAKECKWVYQAYTRVINYLESDQINAPELCLNVTMRSCMGALECIDDGDEPKKAIHDTIVAKIAEVDMELAKDVYDTVIMQMPDLL